MKKSTLLLIIFLCGGAFLRFSNLGDFAFWIDELYHVSSAESYVENQSLHVPFKGEYTRSMPTTWVTIASFSVFGSSEVAARTPFILFNLFLIGAAFLILRRMFSAQIAVIFAFVMCFSAFSILISRECRMYSLFQLTYFFTTIVFMGGFENLFAWGRNIKWPFGIKKIEKALDVNLALLLLSGVLFIFSAKVHKLTFNFGLVVGFYSFLMFSYLIYKNGFRNALFSKYAFIFLFQAVAFLFIVLAKQDFLEFMLKEARTVPANFKFINPLGDYHYYRYYLTDYFTPIFFLYPFGLFLMVKEYGRKGLFLGVSFAFLIVLHSVLFERKADRYIFYIFPFFVLGFSVAVSFLAQLVIPAVKKLSVGKNKPMKYIGFVFLIPAVYFLLHPWFLSGLKSVQAKKFPNWKTLSDERVEVLQNSSNVIAGNPNQLEYYTEVNPEYYFMLDINPRYEYEPGKIEGYEQFIEAVLSKKDSVVVTTRFTFHNNANFNQEMRDYVRNTMVPVGNGPHSEILIFKRAQ